MNNPNSTFFPSNAPRSASRLYGRGNFTTVRIVDGNPFLWDKHWTRLQTDAEKLRIDLSGHPETVALDALLSEIATCISEVGRARITFSDGQFSDIWSLDDKLVTRTSISVITGEHRAVPEGFRLTASQFPVNSRSPLAGVKSCNYLEQILSLDEAKGRGFYEAVRVNERGHVTSGCMSNIFWLKDDRLYTPTLATGCLAGTTREYVLENIECEEVVAEIGELESADAIYLTSAGLGIVHVEEFDGRQLTKIKHPIQTLWPPS